MAQSRINKAASIFVRLNGLLKANLISWEQRPLWYDIYKKFPPVRDPLYRSVLSNDVQSSLPTEIFYKEDELRSYFFKNITPLESTVLNSNILKPNWEIFIETYNTLLKKGISKENLISATINEIQSHGFYMKLKKEKNQNLLSENNENEKIENKIQK